MACLRLINTLFSARIQGLFGSGFGLTSKGFGSVFFLCWSIHPTRIDPLGLLFQNYSNTCKPKVLQPLINNTSEFFSFKV
jgi:hypothetical protein